MGAIRTEEVRILEALAWRDKAEKALANRSLNADTRAPLPGLIEALDNATALNDADRCEDVAGQIRKLIDQPTSPAAPTPSTCAPTSQHGEAPAGEPVASSSTPLDYALAYAALGWPFSPVDGKTKRPLGGNGIEHSTVDGDTIRAWWKRWPAAGIGIHLAPAGLCAIDIDPRNGATKTPADFPATLTARTGGGGAHLIYRVPEGAKLPGKLEAGVDIKHHGYIIVEPSLHPSGGRYAWVDFDPIAAELIGDPVIADFPLPLLPGVAAPSKPDPLDRVVALNEATRETVEAARGAAAHLAAKGWADPYDKWIQVLHALRALGQAGYEKDAYDLWHDFSAKSPKYDRAEADAKWSSCEPNEITYRSLFAWAQQEGWTNTGGRGPAEPAGPAYDGKPRTAAALLGATFQPIKWTVPRILPEGVYLLAASPKIGKSWLALQIGIAVAGSGEVLGQRPEGGAVLYLALEDSDRRLQSRLQKLDAELLLDEHAARRLCFETRWPRIDEDGGAALEAWLKAHPDARLVIIDVFERFRAPRSPKGNLYSEDYAAMRAIKALADKYRVTVLVVHHVKKGEAEDPLELVSGTQGLAGGADGVLVLKRPRGAERGELHIIGRDLEDEGAFVVDFHRGTCRWEMVGTTREVAPTQERQEIMKALRESKEPLRLMEIAAAVRRSSSNTHNMLRKLVADGLVLRVGRGYTFIESDELGDTAEDR